jgi:hypothetical protein
MSGDGIHHVMNPDVYRGLWGTVGCRDCPVLPQGMESCPEGEGESARAVDLYMEQMEEVFRYSLPKGRSVAGFFAESIQETEWYMNPFKTLFCKNRNLSKTVRQSLG